MSSSATQTTAIAAALTAPAATTICCDPMPTLQTLQLEPEGCRASTQAYTFLKNVESAEVNGMETIDGVPHYTVEIFLQERESHIPTVIQRKHNLQRSFQEVKAEGSRRQERRRQPDFVVKRSFAAFEALRREICCHLDRENRGNCRACNDWMSYMTFSMNQSVLKMKLLPSKSLRQYTLTNFMKTGVLLAIQATVKPSRRQKCEISDLIAQVMSDFLQRNDAY